MSGAERVRRARARCSAFSAPSAAAGEIPDVSTQEGQLSLLGHIVVGALGGAVTWARVYFEANTDADGKPIDQDAAKGLY